MEGIKTPKHELLDWRKYADIRKFSVEQQTQLDTLAELAFNEGVDFQKRARENANYIAGDGQRHEMDFVDLLIMWGYTSGTITAEEYRAFHTSMGA